MPLPVIGLIGCGHIGRFHSRNLRGSLRSELVPGEYVAVCDREVERAESFAAITHASTVAEDVQIGPYSHLRAGSQIGPRCRIGNFAEIKQSRLGAGTQQHHFSYVGDAEVGERVNIGAGTVTANFNGQEKNTTVIGDGAFIGSDSMLIAPVTIGPGARTGAGAVVTRDVAAHSTVVGMPARPMALRRRRTSAAAGDHRKSQPGGDPGS